MSLRKWRRRKNVEENKTPRYLTKNCFSAQSTVMYLPDAIHPAESWNKNRKQKTNCVQLTKLFIIELLERSFWESKMRSTSLFGVKQYISMTFFLNVGISVSFSLFCSDWIAKQFTFLLRFKFRFTVSDSLPNGGTTERERKRNKQTNQRTSRNGFMTHNVIILDLVLGLRTTLLDIVPSTSCRTKPVAANSLCAAYCHSHYRMCIW